MILIRFISLKTIAIVLVLAQLSGCTTAILGNLGRIEDQRIENGEKIEVQNLLEVCEKGDYLRIWMKDDSRDEGNLISIDEGEYLVLQAYGKDRLQNWIQQEKKFALRDIVEIRYIKDPNEAQRAGQTAGKIFDTALVVFFIFYIATHFSLD
ncbi:hypothetical protein ACFLQV_01115 [Calditrichota bacterium]